MVTRINSGSDFYANQAKYTQKNIHKAGEEVASGKKINSAKDDAAGLAISEKMMEQIKSMNKQTENYSSEIDSYKVAEGALAEISEVSNDMYQNSIRAMNGTMSASDVYTLQTANNALKATMDQVKNGAVYNETKMLGDVDTSFDSLSADAISKASTDNSALRSKFGAKENGMEHIIAANNATAENTTAAYSKIRDAEMEKSIGKYKSQQNISDFQNMLVRNQNSTADGLVRRLFNN